MADLIVGAGAILPIGAAYAQLPKYDVFRMEANSSILADVDLVIKARRAEFGPNCGIMARGTAGPAGANGPLGGTAGNGASGRDGHNVTIEAGLAHAGGLTIVTDGGAGGGGGNGAQGLFDPGGAYGPAGGAGNGGNGGKGGDAGQIIVRWTPYSSTLVGRQSGPPPGHVYRSEGGPGGGAGAAGAVGAGTPPAIYTSPGFPGAAGAGRVAQVEWVHGSRTMLWIQKQNMGPARRSDHALAWDTARARLVLFGGANTTDVHGDTWEWDGHLWIQVADIGPTPRSQHGMTYDPVSAQVLLFGGGGGAAQGAQNGSVMGDTWLWDGKDWMQVADSGPSARKNFALATDPVRNCVVLFGGAASAGAAGAAATIVGETWEWDGIEWVQREDTGPSPRQGARMAYDSSGGSIVLFGGQNSSFPEETWSWDGTRWAQLADTGPGGRIRHWMASDGMGVTLFGGRSTPAGGAAPTPLGETWSFCEERWRHIQDIGPSPRSSHDIAFDDQAQQVILYGGQDSADTLLGDTWYLVERAPRGK